MGIVSLLMAISPLHLSALLALPDFARATGAVVVVLGVMVLVHEWGHFIVARMCGVRVDIFSVGFGPRLTGWKRGDTDYRISALPLGGYVKMAGDNPEEERTGDPAEFLSKPRWQRALIIVAGPTMNVVSAVVLFFLIFYGYGILEPAYLLKPPVVAGVLKDSPAEKAGLRRGDRLVEVEHTPAGTWEDVSKALEKNGKKDRYEVAYEREGQRLTAVTQPDGVRRNATKAAALLGYPEDKVELESTVPTLPADKAGLKAEDRVLTVSGAPVLSVDQFIELIQESGGRALDIRVLRDNQTLSFHVEPYQDALPDGRKSWRIGAYPVPAEFKYRRLSVVESVDLAGNRTLNLGLSIFGNIVQLVRGGASIREVVGPVGIARYSGEAARRGLYDLVFLTAAMSLNLAILNLLPIPILDGGHIFLLALEGLRRRDFSLVFRERFLQLGMVFLLLLFVIVMYNDVRKLIPPKWLG